MKELSKEIEQLNSILKDQNKKVDSIKEFNNGLKAGGTFETERNVKFLKHSFETGADEICSNINIRKDKEENYTAFKFSKTIDLVETCAPRDKYALKKLLKDSTTFKEELPEAKNTIEQLDPNNWHLQRKVRSLKNDLKNHSSYHSYNKKIWHLSDFEDDWVKLREYRKQRNDYVKKFVVFEKEIRLKEKMQWKRKVDLEKCFDAVGRWKKEATAERGRRRATEKEMKALEKKLKTTQIEMDTREKSIDKERKALKKQINAGLKDSLQL